jgi:hypothetical protein
MQVTLKQSEITAAIAAYLTSALGVQGVSPETLTVTYKQGRSDKNGMTAELEIDAPAYNAPKSVTASTTSSATSDPADKAYVVEGAATTLLASNVANTELAAELGNALTSGETAGPGSTTSASDAPQVGLVQAVVVDVVEPSPELPVDPVEVYDGERRAEPRDALEVAPEDLPVGGTVERVAELEDEVTAALAEDAAADLAEAEAEAQPATTQSSALFG